ncbi:hypothetical protein HA466_0295600 [Hirschfeldia incana]|nr:hypothetical protein HA466_0295600 [Hirschfeldia incana]
MTSSLAKSNDKGKSKIKISQDTETPDFVSTHLYIKRVPSTQALDREVVLRRIRQRRRANKPHSQISLRKRSNALTEEMLNVAKTQTQVASSTAVPPLPPSYERLVEFVNCYLHCCY